MDPDHLCDAGPNITGALPGLCVQHISVRRNFTMSDLQYISSIIVFVGTHQVLWEAS